MSGMNIDQSASTNETGLPRRDWVLLPLLGVMTIVLLLVGLELTARVQYWQTAKQGESCMLYKDSSGDPKGIPNTVCWEKLSEGPGLTPYRFNSSGYRSDIEFGPKPPGTYRVVVLGSSIAAGVRVPIEDAFATRLSSELGERTGRKVEIFNLGMAGNSAYPEVVARRFKYALGFQPDLIIWVVSVWDVGHAGENSNAENQDDDDPVSRPGLGRVGRLRASVQQYLHTQLRAPTMLHHLLYESKSEYVQHYLMQDDSSGGYIKSRLSAEWQSRLRIYDGYAAQLEQGARAAGVPWAVVMVPNRMQSAMISMDQWPAGCNPYSLDDALRPIITSHGGAFIDILDDFHHIPDPEQYYFPVDGHPTAEGHALFSEIVGRELTNGAIPALQGGNSTQVAMKQGR
ncbi:MAG: SGNH/GDSL hydrolase family protein [Terracidiphilus sp.]